MKLSQYTGKIWMNGNLLDWQDANVHVVTHGLHYGSSVFEGERAYNGKIFKSVEHSERLLKSADILGFKIPYTVKDLEQAKYSVIQANGLTDCYVRAVAFVGADQLGLASHGLSVDTAIIAWNFPAYFGENHTGLRLCMADYKRPSPETIPCHAKAAGLYMICTHCKDKATAKGYDDALMLDYRGYIAEATAANIFFYMTDGKLHTPKPDCFLNGITRQTVIEMAHDMGYDIIERHIEPSEIMNVVECFVTGTAAEIVAVREIDSHVFPPASVCNNFIKAYAEFVGKTTQRGKSC